MSEIRFSNLTWDQVITLDKVLDEVIPVHGREISPTMEIDKRYYSCCERSTDKSEVNCKDTRLNGSTASYILASHNGISYKDLDVIFVELG